MTFHKASTAWQFLAKLYHTPPEELRGSDRWVCNDGLCTAVHRLRHQESISRDVSFVMQAQLGRYFEPDRSQVIPAFVNAMYWWAAPHDYMGSRHERGVACQLLAELAQEEEAGS